MKAVFWAILAIGAVAGPAMAQNSARAPAPTGMWRVADGKAVIRVVDCGNTLWGVVAWERKRGRDIHNPNPALRQRPTLGMPILLHMRPGDDPGRWHGDIYNAEDGQTYDASIALRSADTLHVEGCALGVFCGGENWTRVPEAARHSAGKIRGTTGEGSAVREPSAAVCSSVARVPGGTH